MPLVRVTAPVRERHEKQEVFHDLLWYDTEKGKMLSFSATRLEFEYAYDSSLGKSRLLPKPIVEKQPTKTFKADKTDILAWFDQFINYNDANVAVVPQDATETTATFDVDDESLDDFLYDLERHGFPTEVL